MLKREKAVGFREDRSLGERKLGGREELRGGGVTAEGEVR